VTSPPPRRHSLFGLLVSITRYSAERFHGEKFASDFDGHVGLTGVNNCQRYLYPVIKGQWTLCDVHELVLWHEQSRETQHEPEPVSEEMFSGADVDLLLRCLRVFPVLGLR